MQVSLISREYLTVGGWVSSRSRPGSMFFLYICIYVLSCYILFNLLCLWEYLTNKILHCAGSETLLSFITSSWIWGCWRWCKLFIKFDVLLFIFTCSASFFESECLRFTYLALTSVKRMKNMVNSFFLSIHSFWYFIMTGWWHSQYLEFTEV